MFNNSEILYKINKNLERIAIAMEESNKMVKGLK